VLDTIASDREWDAPISSGAHPPIAHLLSTAPRTIGGASRTI